LAGRWAGAGVEWPFQKFFEVKLMEPPKALVRKRPLAPHLATFSHSMLLSLRMLCWSWRFHLK
jgi:hypothetical protein